MACRTCRYPRDPSYPVHTLDPATIERLRSYQQPARPVRTREPTNRPQYNYNRTTPMSERERYSNSSADWRKRGPTFRRDYDYNRIFPTRQNFGGDVSELPSMRRPVYKSNRRVSWDNVFF